MYRKVRSDVNTLDFVSPLRKLQFSPFSDKNIACELMTGFLVHLEAVFLVSVDFL